MATPRWLTGAAAAFAACVATSTPGLALVLAAFDKTSVDLKALGPELVTATLMGVFGAVQIRAQMLGRWRWVGALILAATVLTVGFMGTLLDADVTAGSVDSGPAFVIGLLVVVAWMGVTAGVGLATWGLLAVLARAVGSDLTAPIPQLGEARARRRAAIWLLAAAGIHLFLKGVAGGPMIVAVAACAVAVVLAARSRADGESPPSSLLVALGLLGVAVGLGAQAAYRWREVRADEAAQMPVCMHSDFRRRGYFPESDVVARRARQIEGVADAATEPMDPPGQVDSAIALFVLPVGGGPLPAATKAAVQLAIDGVKCTQDDRGTRPSIVVKEVAYVEIVVTAKVRLDPAANADVARTRVTAAVREAFEPRAQAQDLIRTTSRPSRPEARNPTTDGIRAVDYMADGQYLYDRLGQLPAGAVPVVQRIQVELIP